ncbi:MAG: hypothetical protein GXP32_02630, partial [Kiritimatiellaeota bacterium]|nr:hypothetical protein [Kiritimatiellota bacterium]
YKKAARKAASPKNEKIADEANRELKKARKEHEKGKGEESEKHLRKALEKLAESGRKDKNDKGRDKSKKSNRQAGGKKKSKSGKDGKKKNAENKRLPKPYQPRSKGGQGRKGEKKEKIDPAQAAALLDMMANEEKKLRDAIKEHQKRAAGISKVPKDW